MNSKALADFAHVVLEIMEHDVEWNADTLDRIAREATERGLADTDAGGMFKSLANTTRSG